MPDQPKPKPTDGPPLWDLVVEDMRERDQFGRRKYQTPLQAHNGRDFLRDAYEEALDLVVYLRGAIAERENEKHNAREWRARLIVETAGRIYAHRSITAEDSCARAVTIVRAACKEVGLGWPEKG